MSEQAQESSFAALPGVRRLAVVVEWYDGQVLRLDIPAPRDVEIDLSEAFPKVDVRVFAEEESLGPTLEDAGQAKLTWKLGSEMVTLFRGRY
jgi:hypothetical protein